MRFSNGSPIVDVQTFSLITHFSHTTKLDSFLPYQLVEADLFVCMPALGDRAKVGFESTDNLYAYIMF